MVALIRLAGIGQPASDVPTQVQSDILNCISDSLPQLGYLTFLDFILQWMFLVTGAVILINVGLRRLQTSGNEEVARTIDNYVIKWVFPLGYGGIVLFAVYGFLLD